MSDDPARGAAILGFMTSGATLEHSRAIADAVKAAVEASADETHLATILLCAAARTYGGERGGELVPGWLREAADSVEASTKREAQGGNPAH